MGRRLALLIATYQHQDTELRQLTAPAHDAEAFTAVLENPDIAGFEVTTLINEPHHRVGEAIGEFYRDRRRDDLTLVYFTGHGVKDDHGQLYLAMTNTRRDNLSFTAIAAEQIERAMDRCVSRQMVLILDCCFSGAFPAGRLAKTDATVQVLDRFQGRGRTVLTASDAMQYSFEGNQLHGQAVQSVFTRHLIAGLRDGTADLDLDGDITLDELYTFVYGAVVDEMPNQRPKRLDNIEGHIVIARNINWAVPSRIRTAIDSPIVDHRLTAVHDLAQLHGTGNELVRGRVAKEIQRLASDDSKTVSAAAVNFLSGIPSLPSVRSALSEAPPADAGTGDQRSVETQEPVGEAVATVNHRTRARQIARSQPNSARPSKRWSRTLTRLPRWLLDPRAAWVVTALGIGGFGTLLLFRLGLPLLPSAMVGIVAAGVCFLGYLVTMRRN
jgi:hypothetical protein